MPGTGKSSYARWLAETHRFQHVDVENDPDSLKSFSSSPSAFIAELLARPSPICFDWGFPPQCLALVRQFSDAGFDLWWFDADVSGAKRYFMQRGTVSEAAFERQVSLIAASRAEILQLFGAHILPVISPANERMSNEQIYATMFPDGDAGA
jgi:hypothetical protein